ncbi:MAG: hypothetical protein H3C45_04355 [Bacteroidia bacterium]|nr:hypothetical protein [Bacteroidia bacterium]MCC6690309.1 hypothetical protein [Bacteroidia bacterium]
METTNNKELFKEPKKKFKNTLVGKVLIGAADAFTGGTVSNLVYSDENKQSGYIDWQRAGASISTIILIIAYISGKIQLNDLVNVLNLLK